MKKIMVSLIGILLVACCMSCGRKDAGKKKEVSYTAEELTVKIEGILSKTQFTEEEWKDLDMLLSRTKGCEYTDNINPPVSNAKTQICRRHRDNAVQTKNWRLIELLRRHNLLWGKDYVLQLKHLNYSDEEILKFLALTQESIEDWWVIKIQDVELLKLLLPRLSEKERDFFKNEFWNDEVKFEKDNPFLLQGIYRGGLIDDDKALLECEKHFRIENTDLFNELLRRKRQSSKVWTLY